MSEAQERCRDGISEPDDGLPKRGNDPFKGTFERLSTNSKDMTEATFRACMEEKKRFEDLDDEPIDDIIPLLSSTLDIKMSEDLAPIAPGLLNECSGADAFVESIGFDRAQIFLHDAGDDEECFRDVTDEELERAVTARKYIYVETHKKGPILYFNKNGWKARDVMSAILDYERVRRPEMQWFGGIDCHHIYLDNVSYGNGKVYVHWGS